MRLPPAALAFAVPIVLAGPVAAQDFWKHWGDGRAEVNGYALVQPRYGAARPGTAAYVFVTEDFSDALRVKADPGRHPASDVYPVMKLNAMRGFQTGIYAYNVMTSTFLRVAAGWPLAKISFSSQEWCGHVWHQLVPRSGTITGLSHSYFDGEADAMESLDLPSGGVTEDALPVLVRGWNGTLLDPGQSRTVPFLPSVLWARFEHKPLAWTKATLTRSKATSRVTVPAGAFEVTTYEVAVGDGRRLSFAVEVAPPYRLVRQTGADGEELQLKGSTRLAYWQLNKPGDEKRLKALGLSAR